MKQGVRMFNCAIDLGAYGGRVMLGELKDGVVTLTEMHRFPNDPVRVGGVLYWDALRLFHEIKAGLKKIAAEKVPLAGIGIDTWGVDYALLDARGHVCGAPVHYRDTRTESCHKKAAAFIPPMALYARTGIQHLPFNTLYQLIADGEMRPEILQTAQDLLFMPDLFTYFLTGVKINEYTSASTSQLMNAAARDWDRELLDMIKPEGLGRLLRPLTNPGAVVGPLCADVLAETGLDPAARFIAVGSHDTASAVAGTPLTDASCAYLSCGTWSLLGMELDAPDLSEASCRMNLTNEGGLDGKIRYLKNINGLWMIQQLLKSYNDRAPEENRYGFADLIRAAENAADKRFFIAPNDPSFSNPPDMAEAVREYCVKTWQGVPSGIGETAIAVYNGITGEYAAVLKDLEEIRGQRVSTLHMVGGGVQDTLLCRMTAKTTGKRVETGPVEATALGNIAAQWIGLGKVSSLAEARAVIRRSFEPSVY